MEQTDKKEYELGYLATNEADAAVVAQIVRSADAEILEERPASRIRLAYEIEKQNEAFFGVILFAAEPARAKELEAKLNLDARVLRFLILTPPPMRARARQVGEPGVRTRPMESRPVRISEPRPMPLSNEALEKKIEEILQ